MEKKKKNRKKSKFWRWVFLILALAVTGVALRYAYMFFIDPMSAFGDQLSTATPEVTTPSPDAEATEPPTPSPTIEPTEFDPGAPDPTVPPVGEITPTPSPTAEPTPTPELDLSFMKNRVNILILGWDESPERNVEGSDVYRDEDNNFRSDVIMLLSVNFKTGRVDLISVPRDTLAALYTDKGEKFSETAHFKINAAFAKGGSVNGRGFQYAMQTVSKLFGGIPIQYYAGVNMQGLKAVVDAMGGVDYDVDVRITLNGRVLEKGYQHLNGQQVLDYCRARKGISTDIGRTDRQQRMLFAIFDQLKSRDQLKNFVNIYNSVKGYIYTNLNVDQIATMASFAMGLDMSDLNRKTLAGEYVSGTPYNGASFYCLYNDKLAELAEKVFGVSIVPDPRSDAEYVLSDKAAAAGRKLAESAQYLASLVDAAYSGGLVIMPAAVAQDYAFMGDTAARLMEACTVRPDNNPDFPYDRANIEALSGKLTLFMAQLCADMGYTRDSVDKDLLPEAFYKSLPRG